MSHTDKHHDDELVLFPETDRVLQHSHEGTAHTAEGWMHNEEGRLAIDVSETERDIVIVSPIAGVKPEDIEVFMHNDMLTIRGKRQANLGEVEGGRHLVRECHWGAFSRSIIVPVEVDPDKIGATIRDGVLTVRLPKSERAKRIQVKKG